MATLPQATTETVHFCPRCQGAAIESSALAGGPASCTTCGWAGKQEELLTREVKHEFASQHEVLSFFSKELSLLVASRLAEPLSRILLKWGFLTRETISAELLGRYVKAAARGVAQQILTERMKIEQEAAVLEQKQRGSANDA